jgi:hypothetical protein
MKLHLRTFAPHIWTSDYDTIVVIDPKKWQVIRSARIQGAKWSTQQFIGDYSFSPQEASARLGPQTLEVAALPEGEVRARDWKTGELLVASSNAAGLADSKPLQPTGCAGDYRRAARIAFARIRLPS